MSNKEGSKVKNFFGFIIYFIVKIRDDDIFALGAQLAYYMILSFFPFLIFLLTLIGFIISSMGCIVSVQSCY